MKTDKDSPMYKLGQWMMLIVLLLLFAIVIAGGIKLILVMFS